MRNQERTNFEHFKLENPGFGHLISERMFANKKIYSVLEHPCNVTVRLGTRSFLRTTVVEHPATSDFTDPLRREYIFKRKLLLFMVTQNQRFSGKCVSRFTGSVRPRRLTKYEGITVLAGRW